MLIPPYTLIRSKRKSIALVIKPDGTLNVRAPLRATRRQVEDVIASKMDWILKNQEVAKKTASRYQPKRFQPGEKFLFLGREYALEIRSGQTAAFHFQNGFFLSEAAKANAHQVILRWYRRQARDLFSARVSLYAAKFGYHPNHVRLSSARTRWGSCSSKGSISLNWRLVMAPIAIIDYVVLHELLHLQIQNHSRQYWEKLALLDPDFKKHRAWLKQNAQSLKLD